MFREVLEEKMQKIRRVRTLSDAQMVIHVQNNHLTDASISTLAKYCQQYLQFLSRRSVLSSSSSSSSCSSKRDHKRKYRNNGNNREIIELEASISSVIQAKFDLNFSSNELQGRSLLDLFEVMERLPSLCIRNLNMSWNQLGDAQVMTKIGRFINRMNSKNNTWKRSKKNKEGAIQVNNCIKTLSLAKNGIESDALAAFCTSIEKLGCISTLLLYQNNIVGRTYFGYNIVYDEDDGLYQLQKHLINASCTLTELNLAENKLGTCGAKLIAAALKENKSIKILNLRENDIQLPGIRAICAALFENSTLESLDLSSNNYLVSQTNERRSCDSIWSSHDEGLLAISQLLIRNNTLTSLSLSQQNVTEKMIEQFKFYRYNHENWGFHLLFDSLRANKTLKYLDLRGNERIAAHTRRRLTRVLSRFNHTLQTVLLPENSETANNVEHVTQEISRLNENSMGLLVQLPSDLVITLCRYLYPIDILTMERACRFLHFILRRNDYIWKVQLSYYPNLVGEISENEASNHLCYRDRMKIALQSSKSIIEALSHCNVDNIPCAHYLRVPLSERNKSIFRVKDFKLISITKTSRQNIKPIVLYSDQYGILGILFDQDKLPRAIHEVDYLFPSDNSGVIIHQKAQTDKTISISKRANLSNYVQVIVHNGDEKFEFYVSKKKWDREWVRYVGTFRFKRNQGRYHIPWFQRNSS
jgi:hypothetical protein